MPRIRFAQTHALPREEAGRRLKNLMERYREKYRFTTRWQPDDRVTVSARGVDGWIELGADYVRFDLNLSLLLTPFKSRIEEGIAQKVRGALEA